jgi:AraC-like DNA-binding protein
MPSTEALQTLDTALRAGLVTLLLFAGAVVLRDHRRAPVARLAALFALGVAAYALQSAPAFATMPAWWRAPLAALSASNAAVFWLFSRALFDDAFHVRPWHAVVWATLALAALVNCIGFGASNPPVASMLGGLIKLATLVFAAAAVAQSLSSWRGDLVEGRRRLRVFIVGAGAAYTAVHVTIGSMRGRSAAVLDAATLLAGIADALALALIAVIVVWHLVGATAAELLAPEAASGPPAVRAAPTPTADSAESPDAPLIAALERLMTVEHAYRQDGLTIGTLAAQLGVPEYKLRRAINQGLGHRNFSAFLNGYRIGDAKVALADPARSPLPVLTIAMDAGFQSLGPFNRAFKTATGLTPTEFRREKNII